MGNVCVARQWAKRHTLVADGILACLLLVPSLLYLYTTPSLGPHPAVLIALTMSTTLLLTVSRKRPQAVLATAVCGAAAGAVLGAPPVPMTPVVVALFVLSTLTDRRQATTAFGAAMIVLLPAVTVLAPHIWPLAQILSLVAWSALAGCAGEAIRSRRAYVAAIEERAERAERTREQEAARRVAQEQLRIARDLHDAVAHRITLVNAQAGAALFVLDQRPDQARTALGHIQEASRSALDELRATVGMLRQAGDPAAPLEPVPGLDRLGELFRGFEPAGLQVTVTVSGRPRVVPTAVDVTAYRIVEEALNNVHKHTHAATARVGVVFLTDRLTITVEDAGPARTGDASPCAAGFGLIGMRERAAIVGGQIDARPQSDGGYRVTARLPLHLGGQSAREDAAA
ncbi:sensor histidine kinase [Catenulispora rubra]|uniref:sensor histidine kinase n=1 Tax=Catenulispora rubra TaxID=280293 RepID=UPI0018927D73|nr:sensor histidine kinase [Catenulispora rubra]